MLSVRASAASCRLTVLLMFIAYSLVVCIVCALNYALPARTRRPTCIVGHMNHDFEQILFLNSRNKSSGCMIS